MLLTENGTVKVFKTDKFHILYKPLKCSISPIPSSDFAGESFAVSENASLCPESGHSIFVQPDEFCLYTDMNTEYFVDYSKPDYLIYLFSRILSLPFLLATFLVYAIVKKLRDLHGKFLMCIVATLFVADTASIVYYNQTKPLTVNVCVILCE